jgi:hypothetical protein
VVKAEVAFNITYKHIIRLELRFCLSILMWISVFMASRRSEKFLCRSVGRTNLFSEGRHVLYAFVLASDFNFNYAVYEIKITIYLIYVLKV